jgi:hypothetical protein
MAAKPEFQSMSVPKQSNVTHRRDAAPAVIR